MSIRDVARAAGVSHQTVSRVINDSPNVSEGTREAVLATISALGFRPNRAARALAGGPVQSVTVLATNTSRYGYAAAIQGVEEATQEIGFGMGFRTLEGIASEDMPAAVEYAVEPAGALIVIAFDPAGALALECAPSRIPTAAMIQAPPPGVVPRQPAVWIDEFAAAKQATEYLLGLGHRTVHHLPIPSWWGTTPRLAGWNAALQQAGLPVPALLAGGWTAEWGYEAASALTRDRSVTAVLCGNDDIAIGAMRAMHEAGRAVPDDVSIIGFDDVPHARFVCPALTTVRQDFATLGKACFAKLLEGVSARGKVIKRAPPQAELIVRETTGPPPHQTGHRAAPTARAHRSEIDR
ncbi:MAG: LacI family DNA-binding transcriptional regulator [Solirubrobacterales bacterium]|nr:LacI family DNA-binding transcriptional regulator [Solirubrobacterales bacterium]